MTEVLIVGAGYVGQALIPVLMQRGDTVYALRRTPVETRFGESTLRGDVCDPQSLSQLPSNIRQIVYLVSPDEGSDAAYKVAYVEGLSGLLASPLVKRGVIERFVFASSTAVYAQTDGSWVDESSPTQPSRFSGLRLLEAEALLENAQIASTSLRLAGIYGPGRHRLLSQVMNGSATTSRTSPFTNRIHRDDCAGFIAHLLGMPTCDSVYIGVDNEPATLKTVLDFIAETSGHPAPRLDDNTTPRSRGGNKRCRNTRLLSTGYQLKYPSFRDGYGEMIRQAVHEAAQQQQ